MFFVFDSVPDHYKAQEICDGCLGISFLIVYCPDKRITQKMCDEAVDDSLAALKLIPDWCVANKVIKKFYIAFYSYHGLLFFDEDSGDVTFCCNKMGINKMSISSCAFV